MRNAQRPDYISLDKLISNLKEGQYVIPDFQREFEWHPKDIRDLMRSIFLDYYIGSLLLWKGKKSNFKALSCEAVYGYEGKRHDKKYIVLDGQQRLTAMHYAFVAPSKDFPKKKSMVRFYLRIDKFMAGDYDEAFGYEFLSKRWEYIFGDRDAQFSMHIFPLAMVGADKFSLFNWIQDYKNYWIAEAEKSLSADPNAPTRAKDAEGFGEHLLSLINEYQVSYIELDQDIGVDKVCDIFTQINSKGVRLDVFDLLNALLRPKDVQLKEMWRAAEPQLSFVNTNKMNVYILQVMSILRQAYCSPKYLYFLLPGQEKPIREPDGTRRKEVLIADEKAFEESWHHAVKSLDEAIQLLRQPQSFGVVSAKYLPYVSILPVFAALQSHAKKLSVDLRLHAQRKIRYWYWASVFDNRYSGSVESTSARDFLDMKAWFEDDEAEPALIQTFRSRFKELDFQSQRSRGTSLYNGVFNLFAIQGAKDWVSGNIPLPEELDDHHIVPASWGSKHLSDKKKVNTILNRTPLTADTNRTIISDRLPNEYLPKWFANSGREAVEGILRSHFISAEAVDILLRDPFTPEDFDEFTEARQRTIRMAIESLLVKERLDLDPSLRELDAKVEQVELRLRGLVGDRIENDFSVLPGGVQNDVMERITRAVRKNAALDMADYQTLQQRLEYFDLRELQAVIISKGLWSRFADDFKNKNALSVKFDQIAELRNSLRHSRTVSDIVRKEGEAAIAWFDQVLSKPSEPGIYRGALKRLCVEWLSYH